MVTSVARVDERDLGIGVSLFPYRAYIFVIIVGINCRCDVFGDTYECIRHNMIELPLKAGPSTIKTRVATLSTRLTRQVQRMTIAKTSLVGGRGTTVTL